MGQKLRFVIITITLIAFGLILQAGPAAADDTITLRLSTFFPDSHCTNQDMHFPLAKEIEKATNGKVKVKAFTGGVLGKATAHYDMAVKGVADITQGIQGFTTGRFPLTSVVELPFLFPLGMSAKTCNRIVWELFQNVPELQSEYSDTKVLAVFVNEPGNVYTRSKLIKTMNDFKGQKIRCPMATAAEMIKALGGSPVTIATGELYLALEKGVVDGTLFNTANMNDWKLWEVVNKYTEGNFYNLAWFTVMNLKTWNNLSKEAQAAIEKAYGLHGGEMVGQGFDDDYAKNIKVAQEKGVEIYKLPQDERGRWRKATQPVYDAWVKQMEDKGLPGKKVLAEAQKLIAKYSK